MKLEVGDIVVINLGEHRGNAYNKNIGLPITMLHDGTSTKVTEIMASGKRSNHFGIPVARLEGCNYRYWYPVDLLLPENQSKSLKLLRGINEHTHGEK